MYPESSPDYADRWGPQPAPNCPVLELDHHTVNVLRAEQWVSDWSQCDLWYVEAIETARATRCRVIQAQREAR